jgi:hypothetical protein
MLSLIIIYAAISVISFLFMYFLIHSAPVGWEDKSGFHSERNIQQATNVNKIQGNVSFTRIL